MRAPVRTNSGSPIRSRSRCNAWLAAGCDSPIRIAARLTLASLSRASSATSRLRSADSNSCSEYISYSLSIGRMACRARSSGIRSKGEAAMSAAANKKLVQQVYTDSANRSGTTFVDNLAEDASWIVTGQYSWSHEFRGRAAILDGLMGHFRSFFAERPRTVAFNFIADGDYVAIETR